MSSTLVKSFVLRHPRVTGHSEGLADVGIGDWRTGKYGFIDRQGKMVITPQFTGGFYRIDAGFLLANMGFSDGLAAVRIGDATTGKWGFISR
jgi:hypothetical protein